MPFKSNTEYLARQKSAAGAELKAAVAVAQKQRSAVLGQALLFLLSRNPEY